MKTKLMQLPIPPKNESNKPGKSIVGFVNVYKISKKVTSSKFLKTSDKTRKEFQSNAFWRRRYKSCLNYSHAK